MEIVKRMYANIRLPVNVYKNGEFKMLYDQMQIEMNEPEPEPEPEPDLDNYILDEKIEEMKEEIQERMKEEKPEERIYKTDFNKQKKKRWNTTFRKKIGGNQLTRRIYETIDTDSNSSNLPVVSYLHTLDSEQS